MDHLPPPLPSSGGGGARSNSNTSNNNSKSSSISNKGRKRTKRPNKNRDGHRRGGQQQQIGPGMFQVPQMKVTCRNLGDAERHGKVAQVLETIRVLIAKVNDENIKAGKATFLPIQLDDHSVQRLVKEEELVLSLAAQQQASATIKEETLEEMDMEQETKEVETPASENVSIQSNTDTTLDNPSYANVVVAVKGEDSSIKGPFITARALYVVPAKKSHRRGERHGCAYLILSSPKPEAGILAGRDDTVPPLSMTVAEKARATAVGRLQLLNALEAMATHAKDDAKSNQKYAGCTVHESVSGKSWRDRENQHRDRRTGSIQSTSDYKKFIANMAKEAEELSSRPKPTPGGGTDETKTENGQPLAALVLHLREKRAEASNHRQKAAKKKAPVSTKDIQDKSSLTRKKKGTKASTKHGTERLGGKHDKKKKGKDGKKKVGGKATSMLMPVLLKPATRVTG